MANRITVKFLVNNPDVVDSAAFVPVFQRWIQEQALPGLWIDVADYKHVPFGPGVILVGFQGDVSFDLRGGRLGILFTSKQADAALSLTERVGQIIEQLLSAVIKLEAEAALNGLTVDVQSAEITLLDRLQYPKNNATIAEITQTLQPALTALYGQAVTVTNGDDDARTPLKLIARAETPVTVADLAARVNAVAVTE